MALALLNEEKHIKVHFYWMQEFTCLQKNLLQTFDQALDWMEVSIFIVKAYWMEQQQIAHNG
jgi:ribosome biogenesis protein Tsr3